MNPPGPATLGVLMLLLGLAAACTPAAAPPAPRQTQPARMTPTAIPTAVIYADPAARRPVWPTPPVWCRVSAVGTERPDLGPTLGEFPIWLASRPLPVIPWRNELVRTVWVVDRSAPGDLALTGRQTDGPNAIQFIRPGHERPTPQLVITSAGRVGPSSGSALAERYADLQVYLQVPSPGCYELAARLGEHSRTFTVYLYN